MIRSLDCVDLAANFFVYTLTCPATDKVKYVGITKNPKQRFRKHLLIRSKTLKNNWIRSLLNEGLKPVMTLTDYSESRDDINAKEKYWIVKYREWGCDLKNMTDGGDGGDTMSGRKLSKAASLKISQSKLGIPRPDLSASNKITKSKSVAQIDYQNKKVIQVFNSVADAAKITGCSKTNISKFANGKLKPSIKKVGGYEWKYTD